MTTRLYQPNFTPAERRARNGLDDGTKAPRLPKQWTPEELDGLRKHGHFRSSVRRDQPAEEKKTFAQQLAYSGIPEAAAAMIAALAERVALLESLLHAETGKTLGDLVTRDH